MPLARPSISEIEQSMWDSIISTTDITARTESSAISAIVKVCAASQDRWWSELEVIYNNSNLLTAVGGALDNHGLKLGVPRKQGRKATTTGLGRSIRFQNNSGGGITVPSGTRVWKRDNPNIAYFTTEGVALSAGASSEVHVSAADEGSFYNVSIGQITEHSYPNASVSVTNILPIETGNYQESDEAYRERLIQEYRRRRSLTVDGVVALLRRVPGVKDIFLINLADGPGTFDAIVIPETYQNISSIISQCQTLLNEAVPVGILGTAIPPIFRLLDIKITLRFSSEAGNNRDNVRQQIKAQIQSRVDNLPVETGDNRGSLTISQLRNATALSSDLVLDSIIEVGLDNSPLGQNGEIRIGTGERLIIRSLTVN